MSKKKKKRLPIEQLRQAGKMARGMLVKRGIIAEYSILDGILQTKTGPTLPGHPSVYLPHQWTLQAAQHMMYDFLVIWIAECKKKKEEEEAENITNFFKFLIKEMRSQEKNVKKEIKNMPKLLKAMKEVPVLKDVFGPMRKQEALKGMQSFFIDSFAVSVVLKNNHSVSEFANWFLDWTQELNKLWIKPENRKLAKKVEVNNSIIKKRNSMEENTTKESADQSSEETKNAEDQAGDNSSDQAAV